MRFRSRARREYLRWYIAASAEAAAAWHRERPIWTREMTIAAARAALPNPKPDAVRYQTPHLSTHQRAARPSFSEAARTRIGKAYGWRCAYCGRTGDKRNGPDSRRWHIDHIIPLARGGTNALTNLALACAACNMSKGAKPWKPLHQAVSA